MNGKHLERALVELDMSPGEFAKFIDVTPRQVRRWRRDEVRIPRAVELLVGYLTFDELESFRRNKASKLDGGT